MSIALYMDVHVPAPVTRELLAIAMGRVLYTQDEDFLGIGAERQREGKFFTGIIFAAQMRLTIGQVIEELAIIALSGDPSDCANRVYFLPL